MKKLQCYSCRKFLQYEINSENENWIILCSNQCVEDYKEEVIDNNVDLDHDCEEVYNEKNK